MVQGMRWEKKGRIFTAANQHEWMAHHASVPIADKVDDRVLRIYFGPRDRQELFLVIRDGDEWREIDDGPCVFVPLVGEEGWG